MAAWLDVVWFIVWAVLIFAGVLTLTWAVIGVWFMWAWRAETRSDAEWRSRR